MLATPLHSKDPWNVESSVRTFVHLEVTRVHLKRASHRHSAVLETSTTDVSEVSVMFITFDAHFVNLRGVDVAQRCARALPAARCTCGRASASIAIKPYLAFGRESEIMRALSKKLGTAVASIGDIRT